MKYVVKIAPHALEQIDSALDYIANKLKSPQSAQTLLKKIYEELNIISLYPFSKPMVSWDDISGKYRKFLINNYVGVYSVLESEKTVNILAFRYAPSNLGDKL